MYEMIGKVRRIGKVVTFASGFTKRELVLVNNPTGQWENFVGFQFKRDRVSLLDELKPGDEVKVTFAVEGREWNDPVSKTVKVFSDLVGIRAEAVGTAARPAAASVPVTIDESQIAADVPF